MLFVDETGHEDFADPNYPVFGFGGCAVTAGAAEESIKKPWRAMKAAHFDGENMPLHAAALRHPTSRQLAALQEFFSRPTFGRFAAVMTKSTILPPELKPIQILPNVLRARWEQLASGWNSTPTEFALLHEASDRGDPLIERFFGQTVAQIEGQRIKVHHGIMPKAAGDEAMEVADFVAQAAGRQALGMLSGQPLQFRKDFQVIFQSQPQLSSFMAVDNIQPAS